MLDKITIDRLFVAGWIYEAQRSPTKAADLVIAESRLEPISKTNLFAIVEIKFQGDSIKDKQFNQYDRLLEACKKAKEKKYGKHNNYSGRAYMKVAIFLCFDTLKISP